ncbi:MAG TPA: transposase [Candidatus Paceibacterota bacterium]
MKKHRTAPEVREQIINRIKNDGVSVAEASKEHGVSEATIYKIIIKETGTSLVTINDDVGYGAVVAVLKLVGSSD